MRVDQLIKKDSREKEKQREKHRSFNETSLSIFKDLLLPCYAILLWNLSYPWRAYELFIFGNVYFNSFPRGIYAPKNAELYVTLPMLNS